MDIERHRTELLIIGTGVAGLWAGIAARERGVKRILYVDKASISHSSQTRQCAGATIHALPEDDLDGWLTDIAKANEGLCRRARVAQLLETSNRRLRQLEAWGLVYAHYGESYVRVPSRGLGRVSMMVAPRYGESTGGLALVEAMRRPALQRSKTRAGVMITELVERDGRVAGAVGFDRRTGAPVAIEARAVVIATADCSFKGRYAGTRATTGDGFALAWRAGVRLSNMAFLCVNTGSPDYGFEGTGVALQWGGRLVDRHGEPFMQRHHPDGDRAEIHHLVRAMALEAERGGAPFALEMGANYINRIGPALTIIGGFMPVNMRRLAEEGIDLTLPQRWDPVVQGLHGGVLTGPDGQSDLPGLFAAGTAAALDPGLFNGWSTFRAMGSGELAGHGAADWLSDAPDRAPADLDAPARRAVAPMARSQGEDPSAVIEAVQRALFATDVSILKTRAGLERALATIDDLADRVDALRAADPHALIAAHEARNMVCVAELYLRASLAREETRSAHARVDHPAPDPAGPYWLELRRGPGGVETIRTPVHPTEPTP